MSRFRKWSGVLLALTTVSLAAPAEAAAPAWVADELRERYRRSYIEIQSLPVAGRVFGQGAVLVLAMDGIPANPRRLAQLNTKSPRFHAGDFAPVEVSADGRLAAPPASLSLAKGTRLVVLDLTVHADRVRLFTHTVEPIGAGSGTPVYGCTEFVFRLDPSVLDRGDIRAVEQRIDEWIPLLERRG